MAQNDILSNFQVTKAKSVVYREQELLAFWNPKFIADEQYLRWDVFLVKAQNRSICLWIYSKELI